VEIVMVSPPLNTKTFVATNSAETIPGSNTVFEFVFLNAQTPDQELYSVLDRNTGEVVAGNQRDIFHHFPSNATSIFTAVFDDFTVDYSFSPAPVRIDLSHTTQHGGFAEGDQLTNVFSIIGSPSNDTIRGSDLLELKDFPAQDVFNDPGANSLFGGGGDDIIEGRGGADLINGGPGNDTASYESSPAGVVVTVNDPTTSAFTASGGDANGDHLFSIENLVGSRFNDRLTGASNNNVLAPGLGNDIVDGRGGTDTVDYSADRFFDDAPGSRETPDRVVVQLGLNGAIGTGTKFIGAQSTVDSLTSIENVIGSRGNDTIVGNEVANTLEGRDGADTLDGGFGNDVLIGGIGSDTASYVSHDSNTLLSAGPDIIRLGLGTADGSYTRSSVTGISGGVPQIGIVEVDVLRGIENITGSNRPEVITGNDFDNTLDGRGGNDTLDGGLGNDVIIGGNTLFIVGGGVITSNNDTVSYASHDAVTDAHGVDVISLGFNGADGSYTRAGLISTPVLHIGNVETDVLRGIENVTGSNRAEAIIGNEQANTLSGRGGDDSISGRGGDDIVNGGAGDDVYVFVGVEGGLGTDRFFDESGTNDRVLIDSLSDILPQTGRDGDDLVVVLTTGTFRIVDHFNGHQIESLVTQDGQSMVLAAGLVGGNGSGIIAGSHKGETLDGRGGDDFLFGGNGSDRLIGGDGDDRLTGGQGPDTFVFGPGFGHDVVTDFSHANHIEFDGGVFQNFKQVQAASQQIGADTVITLDANDSITLLGVSLSSLHASHFDFG
jgi:Ca2+-binding RTX toxin-like protein